MAKLPTAEDLGARPVPQDKKRIVQMRTGEEARARGDVARLKGGADIGRARADEAFGEAISRAGEYVTQTALEIQERQDRQAYQESMTDFQERQLTLEDELRNSDIDYSEYSQRYEEAMNQFRDDVSGKIKSNYLRSDFKNTTDLAITKGKVRMTEIARGRAADDAVAGLVNRTQRRLDQAARAEDEATRSRIINDMNSDIRLTHEDYPDHFTAESAEKYRQQATEDYARARLLSLPDEQKVEALQEAKEKGNTWANYIPAEDRAKALEVASGKVKVKEGMLIADSWRSEGLTLEQAAEESYKINDPTVRDEALTRYEKQLKVDAAVEQETQGNMFNEWHYNIVEQGMSYDDIPDEVLRTLEPAHRENLKAAESLAIEDNFPKYSNEQHVSQLIDLLAAGEKGAARRMIMSNATELSRSDYRKFWGLTAKEPPPEFDAMLTINQKIKNLGDTDVIGEGDVPTLTDKMDRWVMDYYQRNQKVPDDKEMRDMLDVMLLDYDEGTFSAEKKVFKTELNPAYIQRLRNSFFRVRGREPDDDELGELVKQATKRQQSGQR